MVLDMGVIMSMKYIHSRLHSLSTISPPSLPSFPAFFPLAIAAQNLSMALDNMTFSLQVGAIMTGDYVLPEAM